MPVVGLFGGAVALAVPLVFGAMSGVIGERAGVVEHDLGEGRAIDAAVALLDEGGMIVLDDFTPCPSWPPLVRGRVDTLRLEWLSDDRFTSVDVMVAEDTSVLVAVRR